MPKVGDSSTTPVSRLTTALDLHDKGFVVVPWVIASKNAWPWKHLQWPSTKTYTRKQLANCDWARHNIWVLTGHRSGWVAIDCDSEAGHQWWVAALGEAELARGALATSGRGHHHWFKIPEGWVEPIKSWNYHHDGTDFDFRADRTGMQVPPNIHPSGKLYAWVRGWYEGGDAPVALLNHSLYTRPPRAEKATEVGGTVKDGRALAPVALARYCDGLSSQLNGGRNNALNSAALDMYRAVNGGFIERSVVEESLSAAMQANGYLADEGPAALAATLLSAWEGAQTKQPWVEDADEVDFSDTTQNSKWEPADMGGFIDNPPEPLELVGRGGMLYRETLHWLSGDPDSGKSVLAYAWAVDFMRNGEKVVILDEEAGLRSVGDKLKALGATAAMVRRHLTYLPPAGRDIVKSVKLLKEMVAATAPQLVIVDSAAPHIMAMNNNEGDENSAQDVTRFINVALLPMANEGRTVVVIDHMTKASEGRGRTARGSGSKLAATQVAYTLVCREPFSKRKNGKIVVTCEKDRNGDLGRGSTWLADVLTGNEEIRLDPHLLTEEQMAKGKATQAANKKASTNGGKILAFLEDNPTTTGWSPSEIAGKLGMATNHVSSSLNKLELEGVATFTPEGTTKRWYSLG